MAARQVKQEEEEEEQEEEEEEGEEDCRHQRRKRRRRAGLRLPLVGVALSGPAPSPPTYEDVCVRDGGAVQGQQQVHLIAQ